MVLQQRASGNGRGRRGGARGSDLLETEGVDELISLIHPREERVFFGAYDPSAPPIGLVESFTRRMPAAANTMPAGDFRDWDSIEDWATEIGTTLSTEATS